MMFKLYFFKENNRALDINMILNFFQHYDEYLKYDSDDKEFRIKYYDENLDLEAYFIMANKSIIKDIHKINPKFLDTDFRVEMSPLQKAYNAEKIFQIIIKLCDTFDFWVYNDLFQDVNSCNMDLLKSVYEKYKMAEKKVMNIHEYLFIEPTLLYEMSRYRDLRKDLISDYQKEGISVPDPKYLFDRNEQSFLYGIEWNEGERIVFPPSLDLIIYIKNEKYYILSFENVYEALGRYMTPIPGYSSKAYILNKKGAKESKKIMKKLLEYDEKRDLDLVLFSKLIEK